MIKAKKSLGQNFLEDENIIKKIISTTEIKNETILEVGPGTGNLTRYILKNDPKEFFVIEKDNNLTSILEQKFKNQLKVINDDILQIDEKKITKDKLIVFGNLPYNISTEILCKWILDLNNDQFWFKSLILMFQKEVADRIISKMNSSTYGRLSILANWRLNIKKIFDIQPSCFQPKPKIQSSVLLFEPRKNFLKFKNPKNLEKITRVFFMHRRKMIKKPYYHLFNNDGNIASKMGINLNLRPQNLDFDTYYELTKQYECSRS